MTMTSVQVIVGYNSSYKQLTMTDCDTAYQNSVLTYLINIILLTWIPANNKKHGKLNIDIIQIVRLKKHEWNVYNKNLTLK